MADLPDFEKLRELSTAAGWSIVAMQQRPRPSRETVDLVWTLHKQDVSDEVISLRVLKSRDMACRPMTFTVKKGW